MTNSKLLLVSAVAAATLSIILCLRRTQEAGGDGREVSMISLNVTGAIGPESLAFDSNGEGPYTGVSDGRILKWQGEGDGWVEHAVVSPPHLLEECRGSRNPKLEHLCGRPLGLQFNKKTGDLYIADAYLGLLVVGPGDRFAKAIATHADGFPFHFTNGLDIDQDSGIIYFTDSSMRFQRREYMSAVISGDKTGRVMKYNPESKEVEVLLSGLSFPNGVALSQDGSFLHIAETTTCRILRYRLRPQPPTTSTDGIKPVEVLVRLPGFPDNIKRSPRGGFLVGINSRRGKFLQWLLSLPWLPQLLVRLPVDLQWISSILSRWTGKALALRLSEEGEVLEVLDDIGGKMLLRSISEVEERNGSLWIGSVHLPCVGVCKV